MTTDIVIKSYRQDYPWLEYCLRSIHKFASDGFRRVVLIIPTGEELPFKLPGDGFTVIHQEERQPGYLWQQKIKHHADLYTDADRIMYLDSDNILTQPITPESMTRDGKPVWLMTPWEHVGQDAINAWFPILHQWAGMVPPAEFMRQHPFVVPRWLLSEIRVFCIGRHGKTLENYIMSRPGNGWSEFNCMGFMLHIHHREEVAWVDTTKESFPSYVKQYRSYDGITPEIRAEIEGILNAPTPKVSKGK